MLCFVCFSATIVIKVLISVVIETDLHIVRERLKDDKPQPGNPIEDIEIFNLMSPVNRAEGLDWVLIEVPDQRNLTEILDHRKVLIQVPGHTEIQDQGKVIAKVPDWDKVL